MTTTTNIEGQAGRYSAVKVDRKWLIAWDGRTGFSAPFDRKRDAVAAAARLNENYGRPIRGAYAS